MDDAKKKTLDTKLQAAIVDVRDPRRDRVEVLVVKRDRDSVVVLIDGEESIRLMAISSVVAPASSPSRGPRTIQLWRVPPQPPQRSPMRSRR